MAMKSPLWWWLLARLASVFAVGLLLGLWIGAPELGVAVVLGLVLMRELLRLRRLQLWLQAGAGEPAPDAGGIWGDVLSLVARLQRRKQYHKQRLLRLLRELRRSTAAIPDGVVLLNPQAEILWFNRMAAKLLQLRPRSDVGLRIENLVRQPAFVSYLRDAKYDKPVLVRAGAGGELYLKAQVVPYGTGQFLLLVRDVTAQQRLEAMRKDFVANASHELRSPLTVIAGYLETLSQDLELEPQLAGPVQEMRRQSSRMTAIIEDLLALSRLESDDQPALGEPIAIAPLLEHLRRDVLARAGQQLDVQVQVDGASRLRGDPAQVHSAFSNLVDNAAKYTPASGAITLRWWEDDEGGHFAVRDTGIGIGPEHLPRLTERFYRVDPGRSRATGGSGLGLAIVKHVMQRHDGSLAIESEEGRGSTFSCHFPPERLVEAADGELPAARTGAHAGAATAL
jgi:two-component system phosphate regulon sensor histidine kinase PhoR